MQIATLTRHSILCRGPGRSVVQCSARDQEIISSMVGDGRFLVRGLELLLTTSELHGLLLSKSGELLNHLNLEPVK